MAILVDEDNKLNLPSKAKVIKAIGEFRRNNFITSTGKNKMINNREGGISYATLNDVLKVLQGTIDFGIEYHQNFQSPYLITTITHLESGEYIESLIELKTEKETYHSYGSAISYLRRYSLITMFGLQDEDDDGNMTFRGKPKTLENKSSNFGNGGNSSSSTIATLEKELAKLNDVKEINAYWRKNYQAEGKKLTTEEEQIFSKRKGELK